MVMEFDADGAVTFRFNEPRRAKKRMPAVQAPADSRALDSSWDA